MLNRNGFKNGDRVILSDTRLGGSKGPMSGEKRGTHDGVTEGTAGIVVGSSNDTFTTVRFDGGCLSVLFNWRLAAENKAPIKPTAKMTAAVLDLLQTKGTLTSLEAQGVLRCRSLSKRISELKQMGWKISRELKKDTTGQTYARYSLAAA